MFFQPPGKGRSSCQVPVVEIHRNHPVSAPSPQAVVITRQWFTQHCIESRQDIPGAEQGQQIGQSHSWRQSTEEALCRRTTRVPRVDAP